MIWTWEQIKKASLQKMFSADGDTIPNDDSIKDYIASMPQACNEVLSILSRVGRYIYKSIKISHFPIPNMINSIDRQLLTAAYGTTVEGAKSYFFEYSGTGTLQIFYDEIEAEPILLDSESYAEVRGFIPAGVSKARFLFTPTYPLTISNLAFYAVGFKTVDDIPAYQDVTKYDLSKLANDYHELDSIYLNGFNLKYSEATVYSMEGDSVLVLRHDRPGNYLVYYKSFPQMVTSDTLDSYEFELPDDMMLLIPTYIASELYMEDDLAIATSYRNKFEVEIARLSDEAKQAPPTEKFESESGWI